MNANSCFTLPPRRSTRKTISSAETPVPEFQRRSRIRASAGLHFYSNRHCWFRLMEWELIET